MDTSASILFAPPRMPWRYWMRSGGCVPDSFRVWVEEIFGRNTWEALSRRYEDLCGNQPVGRVRDGVEVDAKIQRERAVKF